jgi:hypothetical protein
MKILSRSEKEEMYILYIRSARLQHSSLQHFKTIKAGNEVVIVVGEKFSIPQTVPHIPLHTDHTQA